MISKLWAIAPSALAEIRELSARGEFKRDFTSLQKQAARSRDTVSTASRQKVGYVPVYGPLSLRGDWWSYTSTGQVQREIKAAAADPTLSSVLMEIDSPGGTVEGIQELSDAIYAARQVKPVIAIANNLAASAAYWIGSAATKLYTAPSGELGSVGVYMAHVNAAAFNEKMGVQVEYIVSSGSPFKVEGHPDGPLSPEGRAEMQKMVDSVYRTFTTQLARNRGTTTADVNSNYGRGRVFFANDAVARGMADGIQTLDGLAVAMASGSATGSRSAKVASKRRFANDDDELRRLRWRNEKRKAGLK